MADDTTTLRAQPEGTDLQRALQAFAFSLADASGLDERGRRDFVSIASRMFSRSFASELAVLEAESYLEAV